jgi:hypothetical protein
MLVNVRLQFGINFSFSHEEISFYPSSLFVLLTTMMFAKYTMLYQPIVHLFQFLRQDLFSPQHCSAAVPTIYQSPLKKASQIAEN